MKRLLIGCVALCIAACASTRPGSAPPKTAEVSNLPPAGCVAETATRIPLNPRECAAFGHVWTGQDIKRTGAVDMAQALRLLDPTVTISGQ